MRVIGLDVHRSMAVVAVLENRRLSSGGRIDLTRNAVIKFGRKLRSDDEVVIEAAVNTVTIVRLLRPFVGRVVIAVDERCRLHDLPRLAVSALRHVDFHPGFLHRM